MGVIWFNGIPSTDVHLEVETYPSYKYPEKNYEIVHVPGRNGDVFIDQNSYSNGERSYTVSFGSEYNRFTDMMTKVSNWLHSSGKYSRLEDSYEPDYFQLAMYREGCEFENILNHAGRATITFDCMPQRFLKVGECSLTYTKGGLIYNPTNYQSLPYIKVYGSGTVTLRIGDLTITFKSINTYVEIDSEHQDVYKGTLNCNANVSMEDFPKLSPGQTNISFTGGITKIELVPRWWTI